LSIEKTDVPASEYSLKRAAGILAQEMTVELPIWCFLPWDFDPRYGGRPRCVYEL